MFDNSKCMKYRSFTEKKIGFEFKMKLLGVTVNVSMAGLYRVKAKNLCYPTKQKCMYFPVIVDTL